MAKYFTKEGDEFKEVDAFSQDELDNILEKRLERERSKFKDYDDLKAQAAGIETLKSEYESKLAAAGEKASELEKQVHKASLETERVKIVHDFKLPDELAEFVTGESAEDMRARAEKLAHGVGGSKVTITKQEKPDENKTESAKLAGILFGSKNSED